MTRVEELEALIEKNRLARAEAEEAQYEKDLEALIALEERHGNIASVKVARFTPGHPTRAYLRTPDRSEYERYKTQMYRAASDKKAITTAQQAQELLAKACWVHPATDEDKAAMLLAYPGLLTPLSMAAAALAEGKTEGAGKD